MTQTVPFFQSNTTSWDALLSNPTFMSLDIPDFVCAEFEDIEVLKWNQLQIQQQANKARAGGVDTNNINGLIAEFQKGYRVTELPPVVMILPNGKKELWDGYNRSNAAFELGIKDYPFLVYRLKKNWANRIEDAYDMVSLGANNHMVAKRHTINDFVLRGVCYCKRHGNTMGKKQLKEWMNNIDHSFTPKQVSDIVDKIYQQSTIAVNIIPFIHPKNAQAKANEILGEDPNRVLICCKDRTYIERGHYQMMRNFVENDLEVTPIATYTKSCETPEEVDSQRQFAIKYFEQFDKLVRRYVAKRMETSSPAYSIVGSLPQLVGLEDPQSIVEVESV
jgi:hypothetical protein